MTNPRLFLVAHALEGILAADRREHGEARPAHIVAAEAVEYADAVMVAMCPGELPRWKDEEAVGKGGKW